MTWLLWNIWGIHQRQNTDHLMVLLKQHNIQLLVILEPKAAHSELPRFAYNMGFSQFYHGGENNQYIWILWKPPIQILPMHTNSQSIMVKVQIPHQPDCMVSWVYARCVTRICQQLWDHLNYLSQNIQIPWMISGDFNEIYSLSEKIGGREEDTLGMHDFQDFIQHTGLIDVGFVGNPFTRCNNRNGASWIWQRQDRALISINFQDNFPYLKIIHLTRVGSDHTPLCFQFQNIGTPRRSRFVFQRIWADHPGFLDIVSHAWSRPCTGGPGIRFAKKLKRLKYTLKTWNWSCFGNL